MGQINLDKEQIKAIKAPIDKPVIVKAAAGTGKTTILVERIKYLRESGIPLNQILAFTYTNKAAEHMKQKIYKELNESIPYVGTIHSILESWIKPHLNLNSNYIELIDEEDEIRLLNKCKRKLKKEQESPNKTIKRFNKKKLRIDTEWDKQDDELFKNYKEIMSAHGKLSFNDILTNTLELLETRPDFLKQIQNKYKAIFIDEVQDITEVQFQIIKKILKGQPNINFFAVGDPNQCIFQFAYAKENTFEELDNFFEQELKVQPTKVNLNVNYRSDQLIVGYGNDVRSIKEGIPLSISHSQKKGEIREISKEQVLEILKKESENSNLGKWACLTRSINKPTVSFLISAMKKKIPFQLTKFHDLLRDPTKYKRIKKEPKLIILFTQISFFDDKKILYEIIRTLDFPTGKKDTTWQLVQGIQDLSKNIKNKTVLQALLDRDIDIQEISIPYEDRNFFYQHLAFIQSLKMAEKTNLKEFIEKHIFPYFRNKSYEPEFSEEIMLLMYWIDCTQKQNNLTSEELAANIMFLINPGNKETAKLAESNENQLIISTVHKAKGLEWDNLIVIDEWTKNRKKDKNLPYVAYTRARNKLLLIKNSDK
ncbi:UvrD-helicase domain-containing protein [Candidatus Mycoplasma haematohominis]|uniref:UvrD-helicase domain-containing protein n=1 Tax=Candidatus Mycoplasma haematohominis TaxID=1494318 RepID=UPI001C0A6E3F|nr:ATP-dependent helicase [Candidatus Mycoplasma haemohominis]